MSDEALDAVWLTWDRHRRTDELAAALGIPVHVFRRGWGPLSSAWPTFKTIGFLFKTRRRTIITQNPSLLLSTIVAFFKSMKGFRFVQDLHSYFEQHMHRPQTLKGKVYRLLSRYCLKRADTTVVTNAALKLMIDRWGGHGLVLQDKVPALQAKKRMALKSTFNVVFICTYADDEPVDEVLVAARLLGPEYSILITGRAGKKKFSVPTNVVLTGYLSDEDYVSLLASADALLTLTTQSHTLLCGAYEGVALGKPLIMSDAPALREYFFKGAAYVHNNADAIASGIRRVRSDYWSLHHDMKELKSELQVGWKNSFHRFQRAVAPDAPPLQTEQTKVAV